MSQFHEDQITEEISRLDDKWENMHGFKGDMNWEAPILTKFCAVPARPGYDSKLAHEYNDTPYVLREKVRCLAEMLLRAKNCVAYTGAGLSKAAGIRDYASKGVEAKDWKPVSGYAAKPTAAHRVLVQLYNRGILKRWIQQNHDGLPQKAGLPQDAINEIHGAWYDPSNPVVKMHGDLRSDLFEDLLEWEEKADLTLALGTSLCGMNADRVFSTVAKKAKKRSKFVDNTILGGVVISIQQTKADPLCSLRIFAKLDEVMILLAEALDIAVIEEADYQPELSAGATSTADVYIVPYDKRGLKHDEEKKRILDMRVGRKVMITSGPNEGGVGTVVRRTSSGHYNIAFVDSSGDTFVVKLGSWWIQAAVNGTVDQIPIVSVK